MIKSNLKPIPSIKKPPVTNPSFFKKIIIFAKEKTVLFIFIVLVVIGIIIGAIFAIKAIITVLNPCSNEPNTVWSDNQGACVAITNCGTGHTCNKPYATQKCFDHNYCAYSQNTQSYEWEPNSCHCTLPCSDSGGGGTGAPGGEPEGTVRPFAVDGSGASTTTMSKDGLGYKPDVQLICGRTCGVAGANGYCETLDPVTGDNVTNLCGRNLQEVSGGYRIADGGCFRQGDTNYTYSLCDNSADFTAMVGNVVCPNNLAGQSTCIGDSQGNMTCNPAVVCGTNPDDVLACIQDSDCGEGSGDLCNQDIKDQYGTSKQFKAVKYCSSTAKSTNDQYCINKYKIGEDTLSGTYGESGFTPEIVNCEKQNAVPTDDKVRGVSKILSQCEAAHRGLLTAESSVEETRACTEFGVCANGWQAKSNDLETDDNCKAVGIEPVVGEALSPGQCCSAGFQATTYGGHKFCCTEENNPTCSNTTNNPYSKKMLYQNDVDASTPIHEPIACPVECQGAGAGTEACTAALELFNEELRQKLGATSTSLLTSPVELNCGRESAGENPLLLYGTCGWLYQSTCTTPGCTGQTNTMYTVANSCTGTGCPGGVSPFNNGSGYSFCMKNENADCAFSPAQWDQNYITLGRLGSTTAAGLDYDPNEKYVVPYCQVPSGGSPPVYHNYWSHATGAGASTTMTQHLSQTGTCSSAGNNMLEVCVGETSMLDNPWVTSVEDTGGDACKYAVNCDMLTIPLPTTEPSPSDSQRKQLRNVLWTELRNPAQYAGATLANGTAATVPEGAVPLQTNYIFSSIGTDGEPREDGYKIDGGEPPNSLWGKNCSAESGYIGCLPAAAGRPSLGGVMWPTDALIPTQLDNPVRKTALSEPCFCSPPTSSKCTGPDAEQWKTCQFSPQGISANQMINSLKYTGEKKI